ncbi:cache domain-containing protein [bacterium]|nr:cache domain-containing protein [bacterium]
MHFSKKVMKSLKQLRGIAISLFFVQAIFLSSGCTSKYDELDLSMYQYQDTKDLVKFVYDASLILKKEGLNSLGYFKKNHALFKTKEYYLYIYDIDGKNIYHAGMENLEEKNLRGVTDKNGKKINALIVGALANENNPHAWVHYSWWKPGKFYSVPKSSCHFKVTLSDGRELFVGGGIDYPHEEREFIRIIVDSATQLIEEKGEEAIAEIAKPTSQYNYRDVRLFAFQKDGEMLISPAINSLFLQIDLLKCVDEVGHKPFLKALKTLESTEKVWGIFMAKNRYKRKLIKKCLYIRKAHLGNNKIFLAAITDLPEPPY